MQFDIIDITQDEVDELPAVRQKLIRTAQQKKNALEHEMQQELEVYRCLCYTNNVFRSSLYEDKKAELEQEYEYQVEILREQLIFNMSLNEPTHDGETGDDGGDDTAYIVDYELSYLERYIIVRDYYMSIEDPAERMALYSADEVAKQYLGSYYSTLYNYLGTYA